MTVYYELDHGMKIPLVPIVQNCAVPPLVPVRRAYEFGKALGDAIRSYTGLQRVAVIGAGGLSHWIGNPRVGDIAEDFDRWFLERLERGELDQVLDIPDDELELAGNGATRSAAGWRWPVPSTPSGPARWPTSRCTRGSPAWPSRVGDHAGPRPDLRNRGGAGHPTRGVTRHDHFGQHPGSVDLEAVTQRVAT